MKTLVFFLIYLNFIFCSFAQESVIARLPKSGNTLAILHSRLRQYLVLLKEQTQVTDLENGCLRLNKEIYSPVRKTEIYRLCASSKFLSENKIFEELKIIKDDHLLQALTFIQEGKGIKPASIDALQKLGFRVKGETGFYRATGLTEIDFNYEKKPQEESFHLYFSPANFRMDVFHLREPQVMERIRYDISCSFCSGIDWVEVREFYRENLPLDIRYYDSENPTDVTPRRFDEMMGSLFYRALSQLGAAIQSTLVFGGGLPDIRF